MTFLNKFGKQEFSVMDFLGKFEDSLACVLPKGDELICVGDFNLDLCDTGRTSTFQFSNLLETLELKQIIDEPTRITKATATLIDFIIVPASKEIAHHGVISLHEVTDHFLVFCNYPVTTKQSKVPTLITYNDFSTFSINNFDKDLQSIDWDYIYTCDNVEHMVDFLNYNILTIFDCHAPIKTVRVTKPRAPWLTDTIRQMILLRDKALMKFKKSKSCTDWNYYKAIRNYTTQAIRREKKAFLENQLQQLGKGVPWKNLRDLNVYSKDKLTVPPNLSDVNAINKVFTSSVDSDLGIASDTVKYYTEHTCRSTGDHIFTTRRILDEHRRAGTSQRAIVYNGLGRMKTRGMKQACPLSPRLFAIALDNAIEQTRRVLRKFSTGGQLQPPTLVAYVDDLPVLADKMEDIEDFVQTSEAYLEMASLQINNEKRYIIIRDPGSNTQYP
ncbi:uncharacterized protein LOC116179577 [Photinus pyralis]|uniref:uncharacterized protein LOC116179577 n=1 Tax=Photinus pyralis TaxID=7054 RepID=UPI0012676577|nr:uncharacterized protein LOC116179577 [Photinus pyralis]